MKELTEHEKMVLKAFGSIATMMAVKWAIIIGISRAAKRMVKT